MNRNLPIKQFTNLGRKLFKKMGNGGRIKFDDYAMVRVLSFSYYLVLSIVMRQRFALDAVGEFGAVSFNAHTFDLYFQALLLLATISMRSKMTAVFLFRNMVQ